MKSTTKNQSYHTTTSAATGNSTRLVVGSHASLPTICLPSPTRQRLRMKDLTADIVARNLLAFCNEHGELISNLKLQKLLYYTQAWFLAIHETPLFPEDFYAWPSGPVEPTVYEEFKSFDPRPIDVALGNFNVPKMLMLHIEEVMKAYGSLSAFDLERLSKDEEPWRSSHASVGDDVTAVIPKPQIKRYYKSKLSDGKK